MQIIHFGDLTLKALNIILLYTMMENHGGFYLSKTILNSVSSYQPFKVIGSKIAFRSENQYYIYNSLSVFFDTSFVFLCSVCL